MWGENGDSCIFIPTLVVTLEGEEVGPPHPLVQPQLAASWHPYEGAGAPTQAGLVPDPVVPELAGL